MKLFMKLLILPCQEENLAQNTGAILVKCIKMYTHKAKQSPKLKFVKWLHTYTTKYKYFIFVYIAFKERISYKSICKSKKYK